MASPVNSSGKLQLDGAGSGAQSINAGFTFTAGRQAIFQVVVYPGSSAITGVTIGGTAATKIAGTTSSNASHCWYADNITGGTANVVVTFSGTDNYISAAVTEWASGTFSAVDSAAANAANVASTTPAVSTATSIAQADSVLFAQLAADYGVSAAGITVPSGWTSTFAEQDSGNHEGGAGAWFQVSTTGTKTATFGQTNAFSANLSIAVLKLAGGGGGDVTVALTGQALALSTGTLGRSNSKALSGSALALSQGTLVPSTAKALTGQALALSLGALAPSTSKALTGSALTLSQGTLSASVGGDVTVALTGQALGITAGTLAPSISLALPGSALTAAQGTLSPATATALSGQGLTSSQGTLAPAATVVLAGSALALAQGSLTAGVSLSLAGQGLALSSGTLAPATSVTPTGQQMALSQGTMSAQAGGDVTVALTGLQMTAAQGLLVPSTDKALSGASVAMSAGTVSPGTSAALSGQDLTASQGTLSAQVTGDVTVALTGLAMTFAQGTISVQNDGLPPSLGGGAGGGGGGGRIWYQGRRRKPTLEEQPNKHLDKILDDVEAEVMYREAVKAAPAAVAKIVAPFTESKAKTPPPESIDFQALEQDLKRMKRLRDEWVKAQRARQEAEDEAWFMLGD